LRINAIVDDHIAVALVFAKLGTLANRWRQRDDNGQNKLVQISNFKINMSCIIRCNVKIFGLLL
jgi:hypothetical protein